MDSLIFRYDKQRRGREVFELYKEQSVNLKFEMNPGNHMTDVDNRVAKGISNLLTGWQ